VLEPRLEDVKTKLHTKKLARNHSLFHTTKQMSASNDIWLEYLVKHPIFKLTDSEKQYTQRIQQKQTRQDCNEVDFLLQHHTRVMTKRDNDLIVAVGSEIRILNLVSFKDAWLRASQQDTHEEWIYQVHHKVRTVLISLKIFN
jgi:hypothetical protein